MPPEPLEEDKIDPLKLETPSKGQKETLSVRKDVVYKTLIRSLKRNLTDQVDLTIQKGWNKAQKEAAFFNEIDKMATDQYTAYFDTSESNRPLSTIIHDREFIRNDASIKLNIENLKIYL